MEKTNTIFVVAAILAIVVGLGVYLYYPVNPPNDTVLIPGVQPSPAPSAAQGKINIDEVCSGALAYMTFPDGASAEVFVKECKEGKHPEVIERWKASLNIGSDAAI